MMCKYIFVVQVGFGRMSQSLSSQQPHLQQVEAPFDIKKEAATKGEDEDNAGDDVDDDDDREEDRGGKLKDGDEAEDAVKLQALVKMMDPVIIR